LVSRGRTALRALQPLIIIIGNLPLLPFGTKLEFHHLRTLYVSMLLCYRPFADMFIIIDCPQVMFARHKGMYEGSKISLLTATS
jgi:hypothetical protein